MRARGHVGRGRVASISAVVALMAVVWIAAPAAATVFSSTVGITIPGGTATVSDPSFGAATPYPSTITVTTTGLVSDVNVTLTGASHVFPPDLDVLLVGPGGQSAILMADTGVNGVPSKWPMTDVDLTFDDAATDKIPNNTTTHTGTYLPTIVGAFDGTAPAPAGPYGASLSVFNEIDPNGTWQLFVYDDRTHLGGSITGGWSLDIATRPLEIDAAAPGTGRVGDTVVLTGLGLTGTTAVRFGSVSASSFTVDSDTQITATVPAGAGTGMISIVNLGATVSGPDPFVVQHDRHVSIVVNGKKVKGTVQATDAFDACGSDMPVKIQHREGNRWRTVAGILTNRKHEFHAGGLPRGGRFRAIARAVTIRSGDVCSRAISPITQG
jgi:hypothetical protein